jgi:hypothetical protein
MFATVLTLSLVILAVLVFDSLHLMKWPLEKKEEPKGGERDRRYHENRERNQKLAQMDRLLDRVARDGIQSLSTSQRQQLEQLSKELYRHSRSR